MDTLPCPHVPGCSGCVAIATPYPDQLDRKLLRVRQLFAQTGLRGFEAESIARITPSPATAGYRNRARLAVRAAPDRDGKSLHIGLYHAGTHDVVDIPGCPVHTTEINDAVEVFRHAITESGVRLYDERTHRGDLRYLTVRHGVHTGELLVGVVSTRAEFPGRDRLVESVMNGCRNAVGFVLNVNAGRGNAIFGRACVTLAGRDYLEDRVCGVRMRLGLLSFFQINTGVAELAYQAIRRHLAGSEANARGGTLLDLYSGVGTIAMVAANRVDRALGIESVGEAVRLARASAEVNELSNAAFHVGRVEDRLASVPARRDAAPPGGPLLIAVNPPRKGLAVEVIGRIAAACPDRIAYLSCAPVTLLRDLQRFHELGYVTRHVELFDMFPQTDQVETLAILDRT